MRIVAFFLALSLCGWADPLKIVSLDWTKTQVQEGDRLTGKVTLSAPAPAGGVTLVLEPAFKLEIPMTVKVEAGQSSAEFPVKIVDNRLFNRNDVKTSLTIHMEGQDFDFPGPLLKEEDSL